MKAGKTFWTSFFDGFTMADIFGDLRIPGMPDRIFAEESEHVQVVNAGSETDGRSGLRDSGENPKEERFQR